MPDATPWITLGLVDLKSAMTPDEINRFGKSGVDANPDDRAEVILADLVNEIRGYIVAAPSRNQLSEDTTLIPGSMKAKALAIARWRVLATIPGYQPGDTRKLEYEKADTFFMNVAKGIIRPEPPPDAVTNPTPLEKPEASASVVSSRPLITGRENMGGL
jgi:hypothetical protein